MPTQTPPHPKMKKGAPEISRFYLSSFFNMHARGKRRTATMTSHLDESDVKYPAELRTVASSLVINMADFFAAGFLIFRRIIRRISLILLTPKNRRIRTIEN